MAAKHLRWYDYDRDRIIECGCGWSGRCRDFEEIFREVLDVTCPDCDRMLLVVAYPTHEETRAAAAAGNEEAIGNMAQVESRERFLAAATASELKEPEELPDLEGEDIVIEWDFEERENREDANWTVLRHEGREIFREYAYWEGIHRFETVLWTLREKYGSRLAEVRPTGSARPCLLGDYLWAERKVKSLNEELRDYRRPACGLENYIDVVDRTDEPDERERTTKELQAAIERIVDLRCSVCGWDGDATDARIADRGGYMDVSCPGCRRPILRVTPDQPE